MTKYTMNSIQGQKGCSTGTESVAPKKMNEEKHNFVTPKSVSHVPPKLAENTDYQVS